MAFLPMAMFAIQMVAHQTMEPIGGESTPTKVTLSALRSQVR